MTDTMPDDPFATETNEDDPFASSDEAKGSAGPFVPWPGIEDVAERLVVLVPRTHDKEAKVSEYLQRTYNLPPTREEWRADLIILDGGDLSYPYRSKIEGTEDQFEEKAFEVKADELPFLIPNFRIVWGNILGTMNRLSGTSKPFALGRIRPGYSVAEMRKGKTFEDFKKEQDAYFAAAAKDPRKAGKAPKVTWHLEVSDDSNDRAVALAWWKQAKANGFTV